MFLMPTAVLGFWVRGLVTIAIIGGGVWAFYSWYDHLPRSSYSPGRPAQEARDSDEDQATLPLLESGSEVLLNPIQRIAAWKPQMDWPTALLGLGFISLVFTFFGRSIRALFRSSADTKPLPTIPLSASVKLDRPDGTVLHVEVFERKDSPSVILTHGWSMHGNEWNYLIGALHKKYQVITWDLPGLGKSAPPSNRDYSMEKMAADLRAIINHSGSNNVMLVGHSIGGMIMLTFCKLFPEILGTQVKKLALVHTTYTNPVSTTRFSSFYRAIQKPIIEPLLYLQIAFSPLVWIVTWMRYANGSIHSSTIKNGFTRGVSRTKLDFVASFTPRCSPAVIARGALGMLRYDATATLSTILVPVLIVAASDDPLTPPEASEYMNLAIPNSTLVVLSPAKHFGLVEDDTHFADTLVDFCARESLTFQMAGR